MLMEFYMSEVKYNDTGNQIRMLKIRSEEPSTNGKEQPLFLDVTLRFDATAN